MTCTLCSFENPSSNRHCGGCGSLLGPKSPGRCRECGLLVGPRDKFCMDCGASLPSEGGTWDPSAFSGQPPAVIATDAEPLALVPNEDNEAVSELLDLSDTDSGHDTGEVPTAAMRAPVRIKGVVGREAEKVFILPADGGVIGRSRDAEVCLEGDFYVQDQHARICRDAKGIYLEDLESTNGTYVKAGERFDLKPGDQIKIGQSIFRVEK